jgi:succinate-semialdehyde dehydrogenase
MATREMGKPITQSRAEVEKCTAVCDWYAEHGPAMLADEPTSIEDDKAYASYLPIRGVLAVTP